MYNVQESLSIINCTSSLISYADDDRVSYSYHSTYRRRRDSDSAVHYNIPHGSINITQNDTDPYLPAVTKFRKISVVSLFPVRDPRYRSQGFFPSIDCMSWLPFKWDLVHDGQTECQFGGIQSKEDENYNIYILQRQFIDRSSCPSITELCGFCFVEYKTFDQQEQEAAFKLHHHSE